MPRDTKGADNVVSIADVRSRARQRLDDLLHLLAVQIRKLQDSPTDTLRLSIKRTFDKVLERVG